MKIVCFSFTELGDFLGKRLEKLEGYNIAHFANREIRGGIKSIMRKAWLEYDGIIFISATGIATRFIAPFIEDKTRDPAVVVTDDQGKFVISLLSGHLGGANELANYISSEIKGTAVITTASDNRGFASIDIFAKNNNYYMEDMDSITHLTAMMVNGRRIGFYSEDRKIMDYPDLEILEKLEGLNGIEGLVIVSSKIYKPIATEIPYTILRPRNINLGIGCRKGVEGDRIIAAIEEALSIAQISNKSIKSMGTVEVKKDEQGIIDGAEYYNCSLRIFTIEEIKKVEDLFPKSQFVKDAIGVYSVSEPCAHLLGGDIILAKSKHNGITITISKEESHV